MAESETPILELRAVSRRFGSVEALRNVSLAIGRKEVTCLLGDNGAGKSTLIKVLSGVHPPDSGDVLLDGNAIRFRSPHDAIERGIATVYQDLAVVPLMSVWRNFFLGAEPQRGRGLFASLDVAACKRVAQDELSRMGIELHDVEQSVATLSGGERQSLAIARALHFGARLLILDEPTAALGVKQTQLVLERIELARQRGVAIVLITHNPIHAQAVGDRYVILRDGRAVDKFRRNERTLEDISLRMAGEAESFERDEANAGERNTAIATRRPWARP